MYSISGGVFSPHFVFRQAVKVVRVKHGTLRSSVVCYLFFFLFLPKKWLKTFCDSGVCCCGGRRGGVYVYYTTQRQEEWRVSCAALTTQDLHSKGSGPHPWPLLFYGSY